MQNRKTILFVHYGEDWIRGSEVCLLNLISGLRSAYRPVVWTNNPALKKALSSVGVTVYQDSFPLLSWQQKSFDLLHWWKLVRKTLQLLVAESIDLIHINSAAPCQWVSLAAQRNKTPVVCQLHSPYNLHDRFTLMLHTLPHLITVSHAISRDLLCEGYSRNDLHVIHNGVPAITPTTNNALNLRERFHIPSHESVLVTVGSLIRRKGVDRIILALSQLHKRERRLHLVVIGEGEQGPQLQTLVKETDMTDYVHFVGEQNNVTDWLHGGADVFVSGARSEAFGLVIVEASLAGLPVVAPATGGISEIIEHDKTGLLYPNDTNAVKALCESITRIVDNPNLAHSLGFNARRHAQRNFTLQRNTQRIENIYNQILNNPLQISWLDFLTRACRPLVTFCKTRLNRTFIKRNAYEP